MTEGYPLITTNRHRGKKYIEFDGETLPFIKRPHLDVLLHASNYEVNTNEKVSSWLQEIPKWQDQPVWKPSEHPPSNFHDPFIHIYELGKDAEHPIEVQDDGWFISREVVSDTGIYMFQARWDELTEDYKRYWKEDWWYEKPWDKLKDPGAMSEKSDEDSL